MSRVPMSDIEDLKQANQNVKNDLKLPKGCFSNDTAV